MPLWLETPRLRLRPFQDADLEAFLAYRNDPAVARYQGWEMPYTRAMAEDFIAVMKTRTPDLPGKWLQLAVEAKATGVLIGDVAFYLLEGDLRQAEIGFTLATAYQRQGYATEAVRRLLAHLFEEKGLHRVRANCDDRNLASVRLMERLGMRREAHYIENFWDGEGWAGEYWYALLRREWG
ncbi:MAG: GNAT family N-acetyltransferase [Caldilineales bacterium]|nr:GNAT family N-acetyltransferase [Caldilineales bacterium]MCW5858798.1 GNAT family N-acetyltransferase [Caldilineales bacterium]